MKFVDKLIEVGRPDLAEEIKKTWKNAISFCVKEELKGNEIPIGASKVGGFPDLPYEIEFPEMTGFTRNMVWRNYIEVVPESSMQLMAQINLYELAETGADVENLLPKTGMLYFFYSNYGCDVFENIEYGEKFDDIISDYNPDKAQIAKVIYWNGDMSTLRRKEPKHPYCGGVMECLEEEYPLDFAAEDNYDPNKLDHLDDILDILEIEDNDLNYTYDKLFGVPWTVNPDYTADDEVNLLQMSDGQGCVVSDFWAIRKTSLAEKDFSTARFWADTD